VVFRLVFLYIGLGIMWAWALSGRYAAQSTMLRRSQLRNSSMTSFFFVLFTDAKNA